MGIISILFGIFIIVDDHIFACLFIFLIFRLVVSVRIVGIQASIDLRKLGAIE